MKTTKRGRKHVNTLFTHGEIWVSGSGGALCLCVAMVVGLLLLVFVKGSQTFWPQSLAKIELIDGGFVIGENSRDEEFVVSQDKWDECSEKVKEKILESVLTQDKSLPKNLKKQRNLYRTGNFEYTNEHFNWVSEYQIKNSTFPERAIILEREKNGRFYGELLSIKKGSVEIASSLDEVWSIFLKKHEDVLKLKKRRHHIEKIELGNLNRQIEKARLAMTEAKINYGQKSQGYVKAQRRFKQVNEKTAIEYKKWMDEISAIRKKGKEYSLSIQTMQVGMIDVSLADIVRAYLPNNLSFVDKCGIYIDRWGEYLGDAPREANSEGGVYPAIFGTVVMTLIMSIMVVPFGVMTALYLSEYAKAGWLVSIIRIAVNNLAGVPSIVFGVFGLGFFCYFVGKYVDGGPEMGLQLVAWPKWLWWAAISFSVVMALFAYHLAYFNKANKGKSNKHLWLGRFSVLLWLSSAVLFVCIVFYTPYFDGLFRAKLSEGSPTYGTGGILWASMTLALLTLPVVIVATEEAISAVPKSMKEGSYACGASVWQTIRNIVLPRATPGIMTGLILAMARGAGEVAPLMLVGAVKLAPDLPMDQVFPFIHPERSFMHLGFHIYDVGFQSQNSEAAKPMVFTTTLLLILIITILNLSAVWLRSKLKKRFVTQQF